MTIIPSVTLDILWKPDFVQHLIKCFVYCTKCYQIHISQDVLQTTILSRQLCSVGSGVVYWDGVNLSGKIVP